MSVFRITSESNLVREVVLVLESKTKSLLIGQAQINLLAWPYMVVCWLIKSENGMAPNEFVAL